MSRSLLSKPPTCLRRFCVMSNHFHILLEVTPVPEAGISDQVLLERLGITTSQTFNHHDDRWSRGGSGRYPHHSLRPSPHPCGSHGRPTLFGNQQSPAYLPQRTLPHPPQPHHPSPATNTSLARLASGPCQEILPQARIIEEREIAKVAGASRARPLPGHLAPRRNLTLFLHSLQPPKPQIASTLSPC